MLEIFEKYQANLEKLQIFGFKKKEKGFVYSQEIMNGDFCLRIQLQGEELTYQVMDQETGDEYVQVKMEQMMGEFVGQVREACQEIFLMIRTNCFDEVGFLYKQSGRLQDSVAKTKAGVFRHQDSKKWYGAFLTTDWSKFEVDRSGTIEVINVKNDHVVELIQRKGIYPAFHMNKKYWLSLPLDDTLRDTELFALLDESFTLTKKK